MHTIRQNIERIRQEMSEAALRSGRAPESVQLMAVTKMVPLERIVEAKAAGITLFGENYVQEAREKIDRIGREGTAWHMIGSLQSNKAKYAVHLFDVVHSVYKMGVAEELNRRAAAISRTMPILIEVNVGGESSKSGLPPEQAIPFIESIAVFSNLSIRGLMTMPPWSDNPEEVRPYFRRLRDLRDRITERRIDGVVMAELSMGMTDDFVVAIEEGATIVRIGSGIFGERVKPE